MTDLGGFRVCGRRGGDPFESAIRLDQNGTCQKTGYEPCHAMSKENTTCAMDKQNCPITWIKWAKNSKEVSSLVKKFKNVTVKDSKVNGFLLFSKEFDSLPVISIKMLQEKPCVDPLVEVKPEGQSFYPTEVQNYTRKRTCS